MAALLPASPQLLAASYPDRRPCARVPKNLSVICQAAGRPTAEDRALQRYLRNRAKQLATVLPPSPDAPEPDTAFLWGFLSRQLAAGISNEAELIPRSDTAAASAGGAKVRGKEGAGGSKKASRDGLVIAPPRPVPASGRTVPLPLPPWMAAAASTSQPPAPDPAAQSHSQSPPAAQGALPSIPDRTSPSPSSVVHVFWDVESAHPGDEDPRVVAGEVLRLARSLGRLAGCYAYATRPAWAWVPSHFVANYAQGAAQAGGGSYTSNEAGEAGEEQGNAGRSGSRSRCPVCGQPVAAARLQHHMRQMHPGGAATAGSRQEQRAAGSVAAAAARGASASGGGLSGKQTSVVKAAAAAAQGLRKNTYRTGLGSIREYHSSSGAVYRPPAGHQLGLKYVLQREGIDPRVVQNADGASDRAVNGGIDRLLAALRAGRARGAVSECTLVIVSGSTRHVAALNGARQLGLRTVVVDAGGNAGGVGDVGQPDAWLEWDLLSRGAYLL